MKYPSLSKREGRFKAFMLEESSTLEVGKVSMLEIVVTREADVARGA